MATWYTYETIGIPGQDRCNCILEIAPNYVRAALETVTITLNANSPKVMTGATGATFGGVAGTDFTVTGTRTATVKVPAGTSGAQVDVVVTLSDGSTVTAQKGLWYSDEAARNTSPGEPNVVDGVTWKHLNVTKTGALDLTSMFSDPGIENVLLGITYLFDGDELTGTLESGGGGALAGKLTLLTKLLIEAEMLVEDPVGSGDWYLVNYDADGTTVLRKCLLKTLEGAAYAPDPASLEAAIRERSAITPNPAPLPGCLRYKIDLLLKFVKNKMVNAETPTGSGRYSKILYDDNDRSILVKQPLKTVTGAEIASLRNRGDANQRLRSTV